MSELMKERVLVGLALILCVAVSLLGAWDAPELSPIHVVYSDVNESHVGNSSATALSDDATTKSKDDSDKATISENPTTTRNSQVVTTVPSLTSNKNSTTRVSGKVNINTASKELLADTLDGIGDTLAQRIIDYRESHGGFDSIEEIMMVDGIGEKRFAAIRDSISVD